MESWSQTILRKNRSIRVRCDHLQKFLQSDWGKPSVLSASTQAHRFLFWLIIIIWSITTTNVWFRSRNYHLWTDFNDLFHRVKCYWIHVAVTSQTSNTLQKCFIPSLTEFSTLRRWWCWHFKHFNGSKQSKWLGNKGDKEWKQIKAIMSFALRKWINIV